MDDGRLAEGEEELSIFDSLYKVYENVVFYVYLFFHRLGIFINQSLFWRKSGSLDRTILLIGDGIADGIGDGLANGGLATRLAAMLGKEKDANGLRLIWRVASVGALRAISDDWVPGADHPPYRMSGVRKSLFVDTFVDGRFKDAHVVIIFLGGQDELFSSHPTDVQRTVNNLKLLAFELEKLDKQVLISQIPAFSNDEAVKSRVYQRNRMLREYISGSHEKNEHKSIECGPDVSTVSTQAGYFVEPALETWTLSSHGYRMLTRLTFDALLNPCRRVEWAHWRPKLQRTM